MAIEPLYTTSATAAGAGREGTSATADGQLSVKLVMPRELGGAGGEGTNPESLFATGYAACFQSALKMIARMEKVTLPEEAATTVTIGIGKTDAGGFGLTADIRVALPGLDDATAEALIAKAHEVCPYSAAIRGNVEATASRA